MMCDADEVEPVIARAESTFQARGRASVDEEALPCAVIEAPRDPNKGNTGRKRPCSNIKETMRSFEAVDAALESSFVRAMIAVCKITVAALSSADADTGTET